MLWIMWISQASCRKMAPPSGCPDRVALLHHDQDKPLGGQVCRSSKSEETSTLGPSADAAHTAKSDELQPMGQTAPKCGHIYFSQCRQDVNGQCPKNA